MDNYNYINNLAPICLFTYNRLYETEQTVNALKRNYLAPYSDLFIFSDGYKDDLNKNKVIEVRKYLTTIDGFKSITVFESDENRGLANSIIGGVTKILNIYEKIIVLEDDLLTSPNFLNFINQSLIFYKDNKRIHSVTGYTFDLPTLRNLSKDYYFGYRAFSWGWGTWKDKWELIDWQVNAYSSFKYNPIRNIKFMRGGSDMPKMLYNQMHGRIDSWAIRWCFDQYLNDRLCVFPTKSKVKSIGFGPDATHTKKTNRFKTTLDTELKEIFVFENKIEVNKELVKEFKKKFSMWLRLKDKFIKFL